jgi:hypothetical protein
MTVEKGRVSISKHDSNRLQLLFKVDGEVKRRKLWRLKQNKSFRTFDEKEGNC